MARGVSWRRRDDVALRGRLLSDDDGGSRRSKVNVEIIARQSAAKKGTIVAIRPARASNGKLLVLYSASIKKIVGRHQKTHGARYMAV